MLDAIDDKISYQKRRDLIRRLTDKRPEQTFGAEMELALSYGFAMGFDTEIEPKWYPGSREPDIYVENFFEHPAFVEITTISDESVSDQKVTRAASQKILQYANTIKKGSGKFLYFEYQERSGYRQVIPKPKSIFGHKEFFRERLVKRNFELCNEFKAILNKWLETANWPPPKDIRIKLDYVDVIIRVKEHARPSSHNFHSSMPALCYSLEDNPIFKALEIKEEQLKETPDGNLRVVFLCDGGCRPLRDLNDRDPTNRVKSANEIIRHFLGKKSKLDHVIIVAPRFDRNYRFRHRTKKSWACTQFNGIKNDGKDYQVELNSLFSYFPAPRYESSNAKGLVLQGVFKPNNLHQHLGTTLMSKKKGWHELQVKTSSKALYELMSGRIDFEQFVNVTKIDRIDLKADYRITNVEFEYKGPEKDDDYVTVTLSKDVAATGLIVPDKKD
ncbi:hypothetical protein N9M10_00305 [Hellea sp.]|nr:hypothetical protein [Hellea sp.]